MLIGSFYLGSPVGVDAITRPITCVSSIMDHIQCKTVLLHSMEIILEDSENDDENLNLINVIISI